VRFDPAFESWTYGPGSFFAPSLPQAIAPSA
jgi:hypothetical protein